MQKDYYQRYGTTMRGLMTEHGMSPDDFLDFVHQIDHSPLEPNPALGAALERLPGRKLILTNGTRKHAEAVMRPARRCASISRTCSTSSPPISSRSRCRRSTTASSQRHGVDPAKAAMFEDLARNLEVPHALGMTTVLVVPESTREVFREDPGSSTVATPPMSTMSPTISRAFLRASRRLKPPRGLTSPALAPKTRARPVMRSEPMPAIVSFNKSRSDPDLFGAKPPEGLNA